MDVEKKAWADDGEAEEGDADADKEDNKQEKPVEKPAKRNPQQVPQSGQYWLHDDRFDAAEAEAHAARCGGLQISLA